MKPAKLVLAFVFISVLLFTVPHATGWSNGGYSADPAQPDYGTHDWIAQHALDFLPANEKQYLTSNLEVYLYGTELPDLPVSQGGIGDTTKHHVYYYSNGSLQDDAAAKRAAEEYQKALTYLKNKDYAGAAEEAGILTHYIADMAVFGHMMGAKTAWGTEVHHSDYESHVNSQTGAYDARLNVYLHFDGTLVTVSAYDTTINLAYDTTFGGNSSLGCSWMDANYNWSNSVFAERSDESLNNAVNAVADVLHTLYVESQVDIPEFPTVELLVVLMSTVLLTAVVYRKKYAFTP
jgi:hypothetical protein